jgi:hypothetical protein
MQQKQCISGSHLQPVMPLQLCPNQAGTCRHNNSNTGNAAATKKLHNITQQSTHYPAASCCNEQCFCYCKTCAQTQLPRVTAACRNTGAAAT